MATNAFVPLYLPEAQELADLRGVGTDLRSASRFATRCLQLMNENQWEFVEPLSIATLVAYARPFSSGVRKWQWKEALTPLNVEQLAWHHYLIDVRNKHVAHSVNAFEENQPIARYWEERVQDEGIEAIECNAVRVVGLSGEDLDAVVILAATIGGRIEELENAAKAKLLPIVRALPLDKVLAGEHRRPSPTDPATAAKRRARL